MDSAGQQQEVGLMEAPEIEEDGMLDELLEASLAGSNNGAEEALADLGLAADLGDGVGWIDSQELNCSIHPHHDCEDCGLDGILSDFEGCGSPRPPAPYVVFVDDETMEWADTADAPGPFTGDCMGDWYMDGLVMAVEWEEDGGNGLSSEPCYGEEAGAEQVYGSPLWE